jgi:hypothetical protein
LWRLAQLANSRGGLCAASCFSWGLHNVNEQKESMLHFGSWAANLQDKSVIYQKIMA